MQNSMRLSRRAFLAGLGVTSAMLLASCGQPPTAPAAPPSSDGSTAAETTGGVKAEVARKDTLVHWGGDTEVLEPTNFNPYSLGGLGRIRGSLNKTFFEFLY